MRYRLVEGRLVNVYTGEPLNDDSPYTPAIPYVVSDTPAYKSPVTGEVIEGRHARREDLKKHDCVEVDPKPRRGFRNKAFAEKHGLPYEG
jgi:hypothetical protein